MSKSYNENLGKNTTQIMKNAYELNIHKNKMTFYCLIFKYKNNF